MALSGDQKRYSSQVVSVKIFLAGLNGALRGSGKMFLSGGLHPTLCFLFGPSGALTGSAKIFLSGGLRDHHFNVPYPYCKY